MATLSAGPGCGIFKNKELESGKAFIKGTKKGSPINGIVNFEETPKGLHITAEIHNAPPGKHGFHIHEFGDIGNEGKAAGGHYNPERSPHGNALIHNFYVAHAGDLGNIEINENGDGSLDVTVPKLKLTRGKYCVAGRAVILHEKEDDFGQPTGNAGARIGAGTIILVD